MKQFFVFVAASAFAVTSVFAQDGDSDFAEYAVGLSYSPFGPALNLTYNIDAKNSISAGFGGASDVEAPDFLLPDFETRNFTAAGSSSWLGVFWRHRPLANQNFGVNVGLAAGQIQNTLTSDLPFHEGEDPHTYSVSYTENPVMYFGLSYGLKPVKGIQFGIDLGVLSTGGASVMYTGEAEELLEHFEEVEAEIADIQDKFAWSMLPNVQIGIAYGFFFLAQPDFALTSRKTWYVHLYDFPCCFLA
jgi:hypothetical protein